MHQQRLVLNGPPAAVTRLADDLRAAGAVAVPGPTAGPPRLVWETARPGTLEGLCARHRAVAVGVERFELLGDELQRLVVQGADATVLERRRLPAPGDDPDGLGGIGVGLCLDEDGAPLDPAALRAAARRVLAAPVAPAPARSALDDAVLVGTAAGRLCTAAAADDGPDAATREAIGALAAVTLTLGGATAGSPCAAERSFDRAWRLTQATAHAGREELWARPGEADWAEWLMDLLTGVARVTEACAACLHQPPPTFVSVHTEHFDTEAEQLDGAAGRLVATALQALVLFDARGSPRP